MDETLVESKEELELGTFCPNCGAEYSGRELTLGRHPRYAGFLVPILRCANCRNHHAWDIQAINNKK